MANDRSIFELLEANDPTIPEWGKSDWEVQETSPEPISVPGDVGRHAISTMETSDDALRRGALAVIHSTRDPDEFSSAIEMLERVGTEADIDVLRIAARHEQFTWSVGRAVRQILDDPTDVLWEMARHVEDCGKVVLVEMLCPLAEGRADLQDWLLRQGCVTTFMNDEIAHACAVAGRLAEALAADEINDELLDGTGEIIWAMAMGGALGGCMEDLPDGLVAIRHFLRHVEHRANSIRRLRVVLSIHSWLAWPEETGNPRYVAIILSPPEPEEDDDEFAPMSWAEREKHGWTAEVRSQIAEACLDIFRRPESEALVMEVFRNDSRNRHWAYRIGELLGLDLWEEGFAILQNRPEDFVLFHDLLGTDSLTRINRLIGLAESCLPLDKLACGPSEYPVVIPDHGGVCLGYAVAAMAVGGEYRPKLVSALLRSPDHRSRRLAIDVLGRIPREKWRVDLLPALQKCECDEPDPEIRDQVSKLIRDCGK